ncbi:Putative transmembrane protein (Alph_Pro_TM) [SAR116 cluster alpha proteobacterium HIMB100]|nr:Putative transmembrane protein (Alph_Pro_TM) [SAR116 cluster alpha proteobacterium HIMB100]
MRVGLTGIIMMALCWVMPASASTLVADLSLDEVAITTDFNGESLLLFGAVSAGAQSDIVVIFKGPPVKLASRKKELVSGIWMNRKTVVWQNAPSFYHIFSNRALNEVLSPDKQQALRIGADNLGLRTADLRQSDEEMRLWRGALARNMTTRGLWQVNDEQVSIIRGALFRTPVELPANIVPGDYEVRVLHVQDNQLIAEDTTYISVAKTGIGAMIYSFAHEYSIFYGFFAVCFAVFAGWLAAAAFRKQ